MCGRAAGALSASTSCARCSATTAYRSAFARLNLSEPAALERRLEQLIDALLEGAGARVVDGAERRLDLAQRLELAEQLHVTERSAAGDHLTDPIHLALERLDADADRAHTPPIRVLAVEGVEHGL